MSSVELGAGAVETSHIISPENVVVGGNFGNLSLVPGSAAVLDHRQNGDRSTCLPSLIDPPSLVNDGKNVSLAHHSVDSQRGLRATRTAPLKIP